MIHPKDLFRDVPPPSSPLFPQSPPPTMSSSNPLPTERTPLNGSLPPAAVSSSWPKYATLMVAIMVAGAVAIAYIITPPYNGTSNNINAPSSSRASASNDVSIAASVPTEYHNTDSTSSSGTSRYIATQFVSFTINTIGGLDEFGECDNRSVDPNGVCYLGNSNNITEDVLHRLSIVQQVLGRIQADSFKESPDIDHADNVLKIFVMPEFFWRGPNGAYSLSELLQGGIFEDVSRSLRSYIIDEFFNDFLFVFGTVIAAHSPNDPLKPWQHDVDASAQDVEYYNFAPIAKGGPHSHYYLVTKKYISGADFLSRTSLPNPALEQVYAYSEMPLALEELLDARNTTVIYDNVIQMDGLRIGVEICLDHRVGTLWNSLNRKMNRELVDILLITSAGMAIERGPNPLKPGGVVYLSDGEASSAACIRTGSSQFDPNHVCRGDLGGLKHIPVGGPGYSSFFAPTACLDLENIEFLKGYYSQYQTQGCAFTLRTYDIDVFDEYKRYPPSIEVYPTVALPTSTYP